MDLSRDSIDKIESLVDSAKTVEIDGLQFSAKELKPVIFEPMAAPVTVRSLRGFCGFINNDIDGICKEGTLIHVKDIDSVFLLSPLFGKKKSREMLVEAKMDKNLDSFPFDRFMSQEEFAIKFRSMVCPKPGDDFEYVMSYVSKLTGGTQIDGDDDGISQTVAVKRGMSGTLTGKEKLKAIVKLSPYRTFREVVQPESEFLLRVRLNSDDVPTVALFEADGGAWREEATANIADYIQSLVSIPVIA